MYDDRGRGADFRLSATQVRMIDARLNALRNRHFPQDYFAASPWRLLLDIERATFAGTPYPDAETGIFPPTTALRYLTMFERDGLVERRVDPQREGAEFIVLTSKGAAAINELFEQTALAFNDHE